MIGRRFRSEHVESEETSAALRKNMFDHRRAVVEVKEQPIEQ